MDDMNEYNVTVTVTTDVRLDDAQLHDAITFTCVNADLEPAMISTDRDQPWVRISSITKPAPPEVRPGSANTAKDVIDNVVAALEDGLRDRGATIVSWDTIEVVALDEVERRGRNQQIPPMVTPAELAEMAGVTVQRIYQYESDRRAGRGPGSFPAPAIDGYWLKSVAEHWVRHRKTKPGPAPMTPDEAFAAAGKASKRIAQERRDRQR